MKVQIEWIGPDRQLASPVGLVTRGDVFLASEADADNLIKGKLAKKFDASSLKDESVGKKKGGK